MAAETVDAGSGHPVLAALAHLDEILGTALGASTWSLSAPELGQALIASTSLGSRVEALRGALCASRSPARPPTRGGSRVPGR